MFEHILSSISTLSPVWIYLILLVIPFVENIFPPSPSDTIVVVCASLIPMGTIGFIPSLILTTIGSEVGFLVLYYLGSQVDKKVAHSGKFKFLTKDGLIQTEKWYNKYGSGILIVNRFVPGIRPVLAFFAGMSEIKLNKTIILSTISAILWNSMTLCLGIVFGNNVERIDTFLDNFSKITIIVLVAVAVVILIGYLLKKRKSKKSENQSV